MGPIYLISKSEFHLQFLYTEIAIMNDALQNIFRLQDLHGKQFLLLFSSIHFMEKQKGIITVTSFNRNEDQSTTTD